jgi:hypothetical protein
VPPSRGEEKEKTNIYLLKSQMKALRAISERTDIPLSALIRRGVDSIIAQFSKKDVDRH